MIWLCYHLTPDPTDGLATIANALDAIDDVLHDQLTADEHVNDGRLSTFEAIPIATRPQVLQALHARGVYGNAFPEGFAQFLALYPRAPGRWLVQPRLERLGQDNRAAQEALEPVLVKSWHGQLLVPTRAKFMVLRAFAKARKIHFARDQMHDLVDALARYPGQISEEERRWVEPTIRATFGALTAVQASDLHEWPKEFWRTNWRLFPCRNKEVTSETPGPERVREVRTSLVEAADNLNAEFQATAVAADPDLYDPDRYEVLTGITARAIQMLLAVARTPELWSSPLGSPILRAIVEALIVVRWLAARENAEPNVYRQFKEYGRGQLKLFKLHLEEHIDGLDDAPAELGELLSIVSNEVNEDLMEWAQDIQVGGSFSNQDMRSMANTVGLESTYRLIFQPASSEAHGEWPVIDRSVLVRCSNPLHGGHRIPRQNLRQPESPTVPVVCLSLVQDVLAAYVECLHVAKGRT